MLGYIIRKATLKNIFVVLGALSVGLLLVQFVLQSFLPQTPQTQPVLLWWTSFSGDNDRILYDDIIDCYGAYQCRLTNNRNYRNATNFGSYLFYGSAFQLGDLPAPKDGPWSVFHEESPRNEAVFLYNETWEVFDVTATFSRFSDFSLTLQYLENLDSIKDPQYYVEVEQKNKLLSHLAPVLYIQSDCDTPVERDSYVKELMTYIPVDSYGACLQNKNFPKEISDLDHFDFYNAQILKFIAQYKFMLAFENAICDDYITEKLWRPLVAGTVPIYRGSPTVEDWLPNEKSAIIANNFTSPRALADFLYQINSNDDLYREYLEHKSGMISNKLLLDVMSKKSYDQMSVISAFECFICKVAHENHFNGQTTQTKKRTSLYNCLHPSGENSWKWHWEKGRCQSHNLKRVALNGGQFDGKCP